MKVVRALQINDPAGVFSRQLDASALEVRFVLRAGGLSHHMIRVFLITSNHYFPRKAREKKEKSSNGTISYHFKSTMCVHCSLYRRQVVDTMETVVVMG